MIVSIGKAALQSAFAAPARIASKADADYMACVLIDATDDTVTFEATSQVESVRCSEPALVEESGRALVPASMLASIVKTLPDEAVTVRVGHDTNVALISCGSAAFEIPSLNPSDFPSFPKVDDAASVTVPFSDLSKIVKSAAMFAAKNDKGREFTRGILVQFDGDTLRFVASDSLRIARIECPAQGSPIDALFPAAFFANAVSGKQEGDAVLSASGHQVSVMCGSSTYVSRAIDGSFPSIDRFFSGERIAVAVVKRDAIIGAARRASAVGAPNKPVRISIGDCLLISRGGSDEGSMTEAIEAKCDGQCISHVNPSYLIDALTAADSDEIEIVLENPMKPIVISGGSMRAVVLPMRG